MKINRIVKKTYTKDIPVYDVTVEKHHNFAVNGGIVVHNCANYHHGDASLNDAINKMVQDFNNNVPLLLGEGSFGSRLVPEAAAARYTFVKLAPAFSKYFIDSEIHEPTDDPEDPEPRFYLPTIPWILINGVAGIAVGFATRILPRNPEDVRKACIAYLSGKKIDKMVIAPYFEGFRGSVIDEGNGKWSVQGAYKLASATKLHIIEVPIGWDRETYVEKVLDPLAAQGTIVSYKDTCNKDGFSFEVTLRRGAGLTDKQVMTMFKLSKSYTENLTTIDENGDLKIFNDVIEIVKHFCDYRLSCYARRYEYYVERDTKEMTYRKEVVQFIGEVLNGKITIKGKNKSQLVTELSKKFENVDRLVSLPIYRLCKDELDVQVEKVKTLETQIKEWKKVDHTKAYIEDLK